MISDNTQSYKALTLPVISVVVCTYNRSGLLANLLQSLCEQTLPKSRYEVIVVDNNSLDDTRDVAEGYCDRYPNVSYCLEAQQGLSHARNRGLRVAKGEYVSYVDDDCKAPEQWLATAMAIIEDKYPAVFGGPFFPFYNTPKPYWYKDCYGAFGHYGNTARPLVNNETVYGGNMFFRASLLHSIGGFDPNFGMNGKKIGYAEETALQLFIQKNMPDELFFYDPRLYVYHLVASYKMKLRWIMRSRFSLGAYTYRAFRHKPEKTLTKTELIKGVMKLLSLLIIDSTFGVIRRDREKYQFPQNYFYERSSKYLAQLGKVLECYKQGVKGEHIMVTNQLKKHRSSPVKVDTTGD
jgi:glycosyltransferase involved in cell wall biosynthesis